MTIFKTVLNIINKVFTDPKTGQVVTVPNEVIQVDDISFPKDEVVVPVTGPVFPAKAPGSRTGSQFATSILGVPPLQMREDLIFKEFSNGNIPDFMKNFVEISLIVGNNKVKYFVSPDVLCVGTDEDYIRVPLMPATAQKIADLYHCYLPTPKMAQQIWKAATVKLTPSPNGPPYNEYQQSVEAFMKHEAKVQKQLVGIPVGKLISGHKKDIVITKELLVRTGNVAIYGWFYPDGRIIQDLNSRDHNKLYKDYSHGTRLIYRTIIINDVAYDMYDALKDNLLASVISSEGIFDASRIYR